MYPVEVLLPLNRALSAWALLLSDMKTAAQLLRIYGVIANSPRKNPFFPITLPWKVLVYLAFFLVLHETDGLTSCHLFSVQILFVLLSPLVRALSVSGAVGGPPFTAAADSQRARGGKAVSQQECWSGADSRERKGQEDVVWRVMTDCVSAWVTKMLKTPSTDAYTDRKKVIKWKCFSLFWHSKNISYCYIFI